MADTYTTISQSAEGLYKDKGSKFIGLAFPVKTEEEAKHIIIDVKKKYYDATHHCYAYQIGHVGEPNFRINDDGEPSGTAGKPIYGQILSNHLTDILIIVVRYFGGTKLGVSGLINAYKTCAMLTLNEAKKIDMPIKHLYEIVFQYDDLNNVMQLLKKYNAEITATEYGNDQVKIHFDVLPSVSSNMTEIFQNLYHVVIQHVGVV